MSDKNGAENSSNEDYDSYDNYVKKQTSTVTNIISETASDNSFGDDYGSYDDYLNGKNSTPSDGGITPDEANINTGDGDSSVLSSDDRGDGGLLSDSSSREASDLNGGDNIASEQSSNILLDDGGEAGASGFSDGGGIIQNAKGAIGGAANGVKNAVMNGFGGLLGSITSVFGKAKGGINNLSSKLGVSAKVVTIAISLITGGSVASISAIIFGTNNNSTVKYSDYDVCNHLEMINDYEANNGSGDNWTTSSAQGAAKNIYSALTSDEAVTFTSSAFVEGTGWQDVTVTNAGFNFSPEAVVGMISNAYAESKIRADCYEMDYLVHDINEVDENGNYKYTLADCDFELGRYHHSNWDRYVNRMFEIYAEDGMSINESAYVWKSEDGMSMFTERATAGLTGLYPGIGLWQWTGQRAYDMSRFANIQPDPVDEDQDGFNDVLYSLDNQLAFLYLENYGDFTSYGVSESGVLAWGRESTYSYKYTLGHDDGKAYKNISYGVSESSYASEGSNLDTGDKVFAGQQETNVREDEDVWDSSEYSTVNRFPKFVIECSDGNIYGLGGANEAPNNSSDMGNTATTWADWGTSIDTYMTNHQDNQFIVRIACASESEASQEVDCNIALNKLSDSDELDKGYLAVTAVDELAGSDAEYTLPAESNNGHGKSNPSRVGDTIRIGRKFNDNEIELLKDLYDIKQGKMSETVQDPVTGQDTVVWYHTISLVLKKDSVETTGVTDEWKALHTDMIAMEGDNAKYIGRDLCIASGAECATEMAYQYCLAWEGCPANDWKLIRSHCQKASSFYVLSQTDAWKADDEYATSILSTVDKNLTDADLQDMYKSYSNMGCDEASIGFDGIAEAAVSWAWPKGTTWYDINDESTMDGGGDCYKLTKCTSLYVAVKDVVEPNDTSYYSSCCRGVSTAVRASGADDDMILGGAKGILDYCKNNPDKWENLGMVTSKSFLETLEPGDLLLSEGHVMVFVGPDLPLEKWPGGAGELTDCTLACVHASRSGTLANSRGPRCDNSCEWIVNDSKTWYAFRCVNYETNSKWKALAESMNTAGLKDGSADNH